MEDNLRQFEPWLIAGIFALAVIFGPNVFVGVMALMILIQFVRLEVAMPVLFISGLVKTHPLLDKSPIDITVVALALVGVQTVLALLRQPRIPRNIARVNILVVLMACGTAFTIITSIAPKDYVNSSGIFVLLLYLPLVLLIINNVRRENFRAKIYFFRVVVLIISSAWVGVGLYNQLKGIVPMQFEDPTTEVAHMSSFGENYMYFSSFAVFLVLNCFVQVVFHRKQILINLALSAAFAYLMMNSPARGLTAGLAGTILIMGASALRRMSFRQVIAFGSMVLVLVVSVYVYLQLSLSETQEMNVDRLTDFSAKGKSVADRLIAIKNGYSVWSEDMFFILMGMGSGSVASLSNDPGLYAHNLIVELIFEYGAIGSLPYFAYFLLSAVCAYRVFRHARDRGDSDILWVVGIFSTMFLFGMVSNTLGNMRLLWILTALMINFYVMLRRPAAEGDLSDRTSNLSVV